MPEPAIPWDAIEKLDLRGDAREAVSKLRANGNTGVAIERSGTRISLNLALKSQKIDWRLRMKKPNSKEDRDFVNGDSRLIPWGI